MPVISTLRSCRPKLKCLVVLIALAVAAASLLVLVFQPLPVNVHHLLAWENCPNDSGQQAVGVALSLNSADDAGTTRAAMDLGTSTTTTNYRNTTITWGNSRAVCVGSNASLGEVEDLLCLPKPNYDDSMKNPCWWDNTTPTPGVQVPLEPVRSLSCLPYFHILCCSKSGTTDMYRRISMHPDIVPNYGIFGKERLYWGWSKYGYTTRYNKGTPVPFYKYIKGFGILARYLEKAAVESPKDLKRLVTLDGSPPDMWEFRGWTQLPQNRNLRSPAVLTPHLMRHLYRDPKFLILVREPVERLYTVYLFLGLGHSAEDFHRDAVKGIDMFDRCLEQVQDRIECFVNASFIDTMPVDLHYSCYAVYFEEWLKVFPKKHFLFIRTEEYSRFLKESLIKVFKFLDLPRPTISNMQRMVQAPISYHTRQKDVAGPMLNETRDMLRKWFQPWNEELALLLEDSGYLWEDTNVTDIE